MRRKTNDLNHSQSALVNFLNESTFHAFEPPVPLMFFFCTGGICDGGGGGWAVGGASLGPETAAAKETPVLYWLNFTVEKFPHRNHHINSLQINQVVKKIFRNMIHFFHLGSPFYEEEIEGRMLLLKRSNDDDDFVNPPPPYISIPVQIPASAIVFFRLLWCGVEVSGLSFVAAVFWLVSVHFAPYWGWLVFAAGFAARYGDWSRRCLNLHKSLEQQPIAPAPYESQQLQAVTARTPNNNSELLPFLQIPRN
ncbi:hypothetical protein LXL04_027254 [Taraxacum kok-saghyz]